MVGDREDVEAVASVEIDELGKRQLSVAPARVRVELAEKGLDLPAHPHAGWLQKAGNGADEWLRRGIELALSGVRRPAEVEPLRLLAAELADDRVLLGGLDSLRDQVELERVPEVDDALEQDEVAVLAARVRREAPVDLDDVDRELPQVRERRVAGPEVVERQDDAEILDLLSVRETRSSEASSVLSVSSSVSRFGMRAEESSARLTWRKKSGW